MCKPVVLSATKKNNSNKTSTLKKLFSIYLYYLLSIRSWIRSYFPRLYLDHSIQFKKDVWFMNFYDHRWHQSVRALWVKWRNKSYHELNVYWKVNATINHFNTFNKWFNLTTTRSSCENFTTQKCRHSGAVLIRNMIKIKAKENKIYTLLIWFFIVIGIDWNWDSIEKKRTDISPEDRFVYLH